MTYSKLNVEPRDDRTVRLTQNGNVIILNSDDLDFIVERTKSTWDYRPDVIDFLKENYAYNSIVENEPSIIEAFLEKYSISREENDGGDPDNCLDWKECLKKAAKLCACTLERYSLEIPQYKAVNITWDVDYTDAGPCPKEIIIPRAFANGNHIDEGLIEEYIYETSEYVDFDSYDLEPVRLVAEDIELEADDGEDGEELKNLPKSIEVPNGIEMEEIGCYLSNKTGFLFKSFKIEVY